MKRINSLLWCVVYILLYYFYSHREEVARYKSRRLARASCSSREQTNAQTNEHGKRRKKQRFISFLQYSRANILSLIQNAVLISS